jgi:hypothetical protein
LVLVLRKVFGKPVSVLFRKSADLVAKGQDLSCLCLVVFNGFPLSGELRFVNLSLALRGKICPEPIDRALATIPAMPAIRTK